MPYFEVDRAKMILMAADGIDNDEIAARLDTRREIVSQWRKRFFQEGLAGLEERSRGGRPGFFPPGSPSRLRLWPASFRQPGHTAFTPERRRDARSERRVWSRRSRQHLLALAAEDAIRPWGHRCWIFPRDPNFRPRPGASSTCTRDLAGQRFARTSSSSRLTRRPAFRRELRITEPADGPGQTMRVEHEYERGGAWAYLAAWMSSEPRSTGVRSRRGHRALRPLGRPGMSREPYASAYRVFWIIDKAPRTAATFPRRLPQAVPRMPEARSGTRELAQPDRDLLLDPAAQSPDAERLPFPRGCEGPPLGL